MQQKASFRPGVVSVVTPVYNGADCLPKMLDSVLVQSWRQIEMILVDDGSSDNTLQVAESYREKFAARGYGSVLWRENMKTPPPLSAGGFPLLRGST